LASNHTEHCAETDALAVEYLWSYLKHDYGISTQQAVAACKAGLMSVSNILEQVIADNNPELKRSNKTGEDFTDGSDAKFVRARNIHNGNGYDFNSATISAKSLRNKRGIIRAFVTQIDSRTGNNNYYMFRIPYPEWTERMVKDGIKFGFSKHGEMTPKTVERWDEFRVLSIKELSL
jgi:hypothetical protein